MLNHVTRTSRMPWLNEGLVAGYASFTVIVFTPNLLHMKPDADKMLRMQMVFNKYQCLQADLNRLVSCITVSSTGCSLEPDLHGMALIHTKTTESWYGKHCYSCRPGLECVTF